MTQSEKWRATRAANIAAESARVNRPITKEELEKELLRMGFRKSNISTLSVWVNGRTISGIKGYVEVTLHDEDIEIYDYEGGKDGWSRYRRPYIAGTIETISRCR